MRVEPLGQDRAGNTYFYFSGLRLYRQGEKRERGVRERRAREECERGGRERAREEGERGVRERRAREEGERGGREKRAREECELCSGRALVSRTIEKMATYAD